MSFLSADDITQAEHYTKQTEVKRWLILMLYCKASYLLHLYPLPPHDGLFFSPYISPEMCKIKKCHPVCMYVL